jgi:hypothetical protein
MLPDFTNTDRRHLPLADVTVDTGPLGQDELSTWVSRGASILTRGLFAAHPGLVEVTDCYVAFRAPLLRRIHIIGETK